MILDHSGQIAPGLHVLGVAEMPVYLLSTPQPVLCDAGIACLGPRYVEHARQVLGQAQPSWLLLTHVHFDHCGASAHLKQAFPGMRIAASARAAQIVKRPGALKTMAQLNETAAQAMQDWHPGLPEPVEFAPFLVDEVLADGQELDLGGGQVLRVMATPGHTWDFLSYHLPEAGILICSEAGGVSFRDGYVISEFLVDFAAYVANLERFLALEARVLCQGHRLVFLGRAAVAEFLERSLRAALAYRAWVEELLDQEHGQVEAVVAKVKAQEYDPRPHPKQPEAAYLLNLRARVSHLAALGGALAKAPGKETT